MKSPVLLVGILFFTSLCFAQTGASTSGASVKEGVRRSWLADHRNSINMEIGGKAGVYSLNYDYLVGPRALLGLGFSHYEAELNPGPLSTKVSMNIVPIYSTLYFNPGRHRGTFTTAVTVFDIRADADLSIRDVWGGVHLNHTTTGGKSEVASLEVEGPKTKSDAHLLLAVPSIGAGYEYRNENSVLFRAGIYAIVLNEIKPWFGLSTGVAF